MIGNLPNSTFSIVVVLTCLFELTNDFSVNSRIKAVSSVEIS